ncbi:MAG: ribosomal-processing cysteine protease Prp [Clostridiaceae bacterium]
MINVVFKKKSNLFVSFQIKGHADFNDEGLDIVCSAVSSVSQTILIGILEVLEISASYNIEEGNLSMSLEEKSIEDIEKCQVLLKTMNLGLKSMEISYGKYIKILEEEV